MQGPSPPSKPLLLVVEDDPFFQELIATYLRDEPLSVIIAGEGADAIAAICRHRPAGILLDLSVPGLDGFQLLRWLRRQAADDGGAAAVTVLSAHRGRDDVEKALALGADGYLLKPVEADLLRERVREMLCIGSG